MKLVLVSLVYLLNQISAQLSDDEDHVVESSGEDYEGSADKITTEKPALITGENVSYSWTPEKFLFLQY